MIRTVILEPEATGYYMDMTEVSANASKGKLKYLIVTALVLAIDQLTKYWAAISLRNADDIEIIPGFLRLSYTENPGIAFGMFSDANVRWILVGVSCAAIIVVMYYLVRTPSSNRLLAFALALLAAGISGNLIDRIRMGRVIDFILAHYQQRYEWPVFNVADTVITIGAALMAIELFLTPQVEKATAGDGDESPILEAAPTEGDERTVKGS